jgi:alkanesulfonate monooxygenase SsuD/methylene tetrahydromethanopterin reductase-like flavin-dependent oxidoreductase (luciferase family)
MPARCAIGSAQECIDKIQSYVDAGCSKFVLWPIVPPDELVPQIERYGKEIIPHFS